MWRVSPSFSENFTSIVAPCQSFFHEQFIEGWIEISFLWLSVKYLMFEVTCLCLSVNESCRPRAKGLDLFLQKIWYNLGYEILSLLNLRSNKKRFEYILILRSKFNDSSWHYFLLHDRTGECKIQCVSWNDQIKFSFAFSKTVLLCFSVLLVFLHLSPILWLTIWSEYMFLSYAI